MNFVILLFLIKSSCLLSAYAVGEVQLSSSPSSLSSQRNEKSNKPHELPYNGAAIEEVVVESSLYIKPKGRTNVRRVRSILPQSLVNAFVEHKRVKRQFQRRPHHGGGGGNFGYNGGFNGGFNGGYNDGFNGGGFNDISAGTNAGVGFGSGSGSQAGSNAGFGSKGATAGADANFNIEGAGEQHGQSQAQSNAAANGQFNDGFNFGSGASNAQAQAFESQGAAGNFGASSAGTLAQNTQGNPFGVQNSVGASLSQVYKLPNGQTINFASTNSFANGPFSNNANSHGGAVSVSGPRH